VAGWETLTGAVVGVGVGEAASTAIEPVLEPQRQKALSDARAMVFDLGTIAELVAQGLLDRDAAHAEGLRNGFDPSRTDRAIQLALKAAPVAELLELWRRGKISEAQVDHGLAKEQIEPQYWEPIKELFVGRLDPAVIATAIQRGIMADPGFLPVGPPTATGKVPAFPVSPLDPIAEAKARGIDYDRLFVETAIVGLPLSLQQAASAYFREIIELPDFQRAVSEGNTRNEWGAAALEQAREILTAGEYAELQLRGFYGEAERRANTAKHGMSQADSDLLYNVLGRSVSVHQVTTGLARGGTYPSTYADVPQPYRAAIQRSNIREEWVGLAYANRYSYPSGFQIRGEAQAGRLTFDETQQILLEVGWSPKWAEHFATSWTAGTKAVADTHVGKAETQLWTTLHRSYVAEETDDPTATATLGTLGVDPAAVPQVLALWQSERELIRKQLTPAQVKKAFRGGVQNPATGSAWTRDDALAALIARGYSPNDADTFLNL
jgi:hypothetical protein